MTVIDHTECRLCKKKLIIKLLIYLSSENLLVKNCFCCESFDRHIVPEAFKKIFVLKRIHDVLQVLLQKVPRVPHVHVLRVPHVQVLRLQHTLIGFLCKDNRLFKENAKITINTK